jgi:hypothetical protein
MGGSNDESNLTIPISIKEHAKLHKDLWFKHGLKQDYIAWKCLSGRITNEQARLMAAKIGQDNSEKYKKSRQVAGKKLSKLNNFEHCSKGGKAASIKLVKWQKENKDKFIAQCAVLGKNSTERKLKPHEYLGVVYRSKKALQEVHKMSNCGFYGKLNRGEIVRIPVAQKIARRLK